METAKKRDVIMEGIMVELGELGRFQIVQYVILSVIVLFTSAAYFSYVFTAGQLDYR